MNSGHRPPLVSWLIWACAALYYLYQFILRVSAGVIVPDVMQELGLTEAVFGTVASLYSLAYSSVQLPLGMTTDRYGTRPVLIGGACLAVCGTFLFASGSSPWALMAGRFMIGAGSAVGFLSCVKLATVWFPHTWLSRVNGLTIMLGTLGGTLGGKPFALLAQAVGWRASLWWTAVAGTGLVVLLVFLVRDRKSLAMPRVVHDGPKDGYHWLQALRLIVRQPVCWWVAVYNFLMYIPLAGIADLWGIPFLTQVHAMDRPSAARVCMNIYIGMATGGPFFGWFSERIKSRRLPMMTGAFMASVFLSLVVFWKDVPPLGLEVLLFGAGFFIGCKTLGFTYICELVPHALNGTAVGFLNTICMLSGLMIQPLIGGLLTWQWEGQMAEGFRAFTHGQYALALGAVPAAVFWSALLMKRLPETWRAHHVLHSDLEKGPSKERPTPH